MFQQGNVMGRMADPRHCVRLRTVYAFAWLCVGRLHQSAGERARVPPVPPPLRPSRARAPRPHLLQAVLEAGREALDLVLREGHALAVPLPLVAVVVDLLVLSPAAAPGGGALSRRAAGGAVRCPGGCRRHGAAAGGGGRGGVAARGRFPSCLQEGRATAARRARAHQLSGWHTPGAYFLERSSTQYWVGTRFTLRVVGRAARGRAARSGPAGALAL